MPVIPITRAALWRHTQTLAIVGLVLYGVVGLALRGGGPELRAPAPEFSLPIVGAEGTQSLAELRGQPVVLEIMASWCDACARSVSTMRRVVERRRATPVRFLGVAVQTEPQQAEVMRRDWSLPFPLLLDDGQVARGYDINVLPTFVLVDAAGVVRRVRGGLVGEADLETWLTEVGAGR